MIFKIFPADILVNIFFDSLSCPKTLGDFMGINFLRALSPKNITPPPTRNSEQSLRSLKRLALKLQSSGWGGFRCHEAVVTLLPPLQVWKKCSVHLDFSAASSETGLRYGIERSWLMFLDIVQQKKSYKLIFFFSLLEVQ